ncbi:MAG TPA: T9SS type A sorting domain-containing protein [Bacteroidales bacterium]|nr:T9SS type A sorting domain-containing protein [Bacteroidales bacterium]HPM93309.1 T9SS type A sorting domain-containing protein [Bacteroidales bacterium]
MDNARVVGNKFDIAGMTIPVEPYKYGLYIEYSTGYTIEENYFEEKKSGIGSIGLYISNSGKDPNEVYKNDFKNLDYGIVAYGINRDEEGAGLCLKCNNFETCTSDIHVIPENDGYGNWLQGREQGIASMQGTNSQGSNTSPAGNTFTKLDDVPEAFNYFNHENCNKIYYFRHQNNNTNLKIVPEPTSSPDWFEPLGVSNTVFNSQEEACPSNLGGGSINFSLEKNLISFENELLVTYSDSIQALKDGGDTYTLNLNVYTSTPEESYQIRQQLLDESPYLSDTVIKSAIIKENVLPNVMIRDVLVANPQAAKSSEILDKVIERIDPMPEEMMSDILNGRIIKGALEVLEDKFASHNTLKYKSLIKLESYYKLDTLDFHGSLDSLTNLWLNETDPEILYKLVFLYFNNDDSANCLSTLNSIPQLNELSPEQLQDFEDFSSLIEILWTLKQCNCELDSTIAEQLMLLVFRASKPGALARNTLVANGMLTYNEPIYLSDELKSGIVMPDKPFKGLQSEDRLQIFPNPAKEFIIVSYNLKNLNGQSSILINSIDGKPCYSLDLNGEINQVVVSLSTFSAGTYVIQLENKGKIIGSSTFVIAK